MARPKRADADVVVPLTDEQQQLVEKNQGLVHKVASVMRCRPAVLALGQDDVFQVGILGLSRAARFYKPELGAFSTYAWKSIWREIMRAANNDSRLKMTSLDAITDKGFAATMQEGEFDESALQALDRALDRLPSYYVSMIRRAYGIGVERETLTVIARGYRDKTRHQIREKIKHGLGLLKKLLAKEIE